MKKLGLHQPIRNLTCGDSEILLVVIGVEVAGLEKTGFVYLLEFFFEGRGRSGGVISCVWSALG